MKSIKKRLQVNQLITVIILRSFVLSASLVLAPAFLCVTLHLIGDQYHSAACGTWRHDMGITCPSVFACSSHGPLINTIVKTTKFLFFFKSWWYWGSLKLIIFFFLQKVSNYFWKKNYSSPCLKWNIALKKMYIFIILNDWLIVTINLFHIY